MLATLIIYSVAIVVLIVLIWCSALPTLNHVVISVDVLNRWMLDRENLIVIDVRTKGLRHTPEDNVTGALKMHVSQLPSLLQWIPPQTTLVFCCQNETNFIDIHIEEALHKAKIDTIYLLLRVSQEPAVRASDFSSLRRRQRAGS